MQADLVEVGLQKELEKEIHPVVTTANGIQITTADDYQYAADHLTIVKTMQKKVKAEVIEPIMDAKRKIEETRKRFYDMLMAPLDEAEKILKDKQLTWGRDQERKAAEEQRRLQAESDARAERERQRLLKEAEKLKTPELKEERMRQAEEVEAPVVTVQTEVPKVQGQSFRKTWKARIVNKHEFVKAAVEQKNETYMAMIEINQSKLDGIAKATKGEVDYPGIEFYEETTMASRGA